MTRVSTIGDRTPSSSGRPIMAFRDHARAQGMRIFAGLRKKSVPSPCPPQDERKGRKFGANSTLSGTIINALSAKRATSGGKRVLSQLFDRFRSKSSRQPTTRQLSIVEETSGFLDFHDHQLFYRIFHPPKGSRSDKTPVVVLHGGPQVAHNYLENLGELARLGHPVVMYDHSGCGLSGTPSDTSILSLQYLRDQVAFVMDELDLAEVHLFGQSAGGVVALEFVLSYPESVASLTLSSTPSDIPTFLQEAEMLAHQLPSDVREKILNSWDHSGESYKKAMEIFNKNFLCRLEEWPECLQKSFEMAGSSFRGVGAICDWSISPGDMAKIDVPVLHLSGKYDEVTPRCIRPLHENIPDSEWVIFQNSSHMPFLEEPTKFFNEMEKFLNRIEPFDAFAQRQPLVVGQGKKQPPFAS